MEKIQEQPIHLRAVLTKHIMEPLTTEKQITLPINLQDKLDKLLNKFP